MVTFTKLGSCVSSDVFNFLDIEEYKLLHTYTGINIGVINEQSNIEIDERDICADNNFWKKCRNFVLSMGTY